LRTCGVAAFLEKQGPEDVDHRLARGSREEGRPDPGRQLLWHHGIMVLKIPYKAVANVLTVRLGTRGGGGGYTVVESRGEHVESENGIRVRVRRGCPDSIWNLKSIHYISSRLAGKGAGCYFWTW
jgi:hypothetical protein